MSLIAVPGITPFGHTLLHTKNFSQAGTASFCKTRDTTLSCFSLLTLESRINLSDYAKNPEYLLSQVAKKNLY